MEYRYSSCLLVLLFSATYIVQPAAGQISITSEDITSLIVIEVMMGLESPAVDSAAWVPNHV